MNLTKNVPWQLFPHGSILSLLIYLPIPYSPLARISLQISQIYKVQYFSPNKISPHRGSGSCNQHSGVNKAQKNTFSRWVFQVCTLVDFLTFISLELVYPVLWPFLLTSTRTYVYSIVIFWVPGVWLFTTYTKTNSVLLSSTIGSLVHCWVSGQVVQRLSSDCRIQYLILTYTCAGKVNG